VARNLPSGTVTFVFTDIEGSTRLLHALGAERYAEALAEHRRILRDAFARHGGVEVDTQGDAFFVAFPTAPGALAAAADAREALAAGPIRVRMGLHTGTPLLSDEGYVGPDVHRAARIAAVAHGGQVLLSAATAALVDGVRLRDLGEHRLKDLSGPERIYQLGDGEFPRLKSLGQTNLPIPATPFLGRERELREIAELLSRADVRLLTLTGPGGTGKTRLALQAAAAAADDFPAGVWWVPLAALRDPALVLETAAKALGVSGQFAEYIGDRHLLLVFDNFEHLIEAAPELSHLLAACPNVHLLVTSRELLRLPGEQAYPVPPLEPLEGTQLFLARARAVKPDFHAAGAVADLCERLDQLPLAIELAAARIRLLSPEQLLERLSVRFDLLTGGRVADPRQRTLRATIEWSHELLTPDEQRLFAWLAVFRSGCTLEAAEEVADADIDTLQSLVDKSLVRVRADRFWMLETIREYAEERLGRSGEANHVRRRHADFFLRLAEQGEPHVPARPKEWLEPLEREHDNFRAALDRLERATELGLAMRLTGALWYFWYIRGFMAEGRRRVEAALAAAPEPTVGRAKVLNAATAFALEFGDARTARMRADEALAINVQLAHAWGIARSTFLLGQVVREEGDLAGARDLFDDSARQFRGVGDEHFELLATAVSAWICRLLGEYDRGRALDEDTLRRARAARNVRIEAHVLLGLAEAAHAAGETEEALSDLKRAYEVFRDLGARNELADSLMRFAEVVAARSATTAVRLLACADIAFKETTGASNSVVAARNARTLASVRTRLDEAAFADAWAEGGALTPDQAVELALAEVD